VVEIPRVLRVLAALGTDIGRGGSSQVATDDTGPFPFKGKIRRLVFDEPKRTNRRAEKEHLEALAVVEMAQE
jgi:hypothetical protein